MKAVVIDIHKCNGCYNCQVACKDEHVGNDWAPYARPQPEIGQFWCKVKENVGYQFGFDGLCRRRIAQSVVHDRQFRPG